MLHIETNEDYNHIVDAYSDMIFRIAYQILYNVHDSEDVIQNVFIKLLKQKDICFNNEKHLKSWLIRVTINNSLDCKKSFFRRSMVSIEDYDFPFEQEEQSIMEAQHE